MASKINKDALHAAIGMLRINYPKGTRVELVKMDDAKAPPIGTHGTVTTVDSIGTIHLYQLHSSSLGVINPKHAYCGM